jgi:CRISPR-associated protein Csd1
MMLRALVELARQLELPGAGAGVDPDAAIAYVAALHGLIERGEAPGPDHRYGVRLGRDTAAVFWSTAPVEVLDFFADLWNGPRPEAADDFFAAPWSKEPPGALDNERFYAVTLGASGGRVVVRDWFDTSLGRLKRTARRFVDDLAIGGDARPIAMGQLLAAVAPTGGARAPQDVSGSIFQASLRGTPLPREVLRQALLCMRAAPGREREAAALLRVRAALVKAALRGLARVDPSCAHLGGISASLDEDNTHAAYCLGRLFAALERAQLQTRRGPGATMRDRYFASASMAPASVFPRLLRLAEQAVCQARADGSDAGVGQTIEHLGGRLPATRFPNSLSLDDQGLFGVGYYHQRESLAAAPA